MRRPGICSERSFRPRSNSIYLPARRHTAPRGAAAFGESFLYYSAPNPFTGQAQRKVTFVKRVVSYGLPLLVGASYYQRGP